MADLCSRVGDLERKRGWSSSCDSNTSERNISKKRKLLENESDEDSDIEVSNEETHHIPDTQQPSTSKELDNILSDGELVWLVGRLVLLLYVPSQQLWSLRDGQFT